MGSQKNRLMAVVLVSMTLVAGNVNAGKWENVIKFFAQPRTYLPAVCCTAKFSVPVVSGAAAGTLAHWLGLGSVPVTGAGFLAAYAAHMLTFGDDTIPDERVRVYVDSGTTPKQLRRFLNEYAIANIGEAGEPLDVSLEESICENPKQFCKKIVRLWEIRSWVHFNDPEMFNATQTNWGHHQSEPFLGIGPSTNNPLFAWAKEIKPSWHVGYDIASYYFPETKYQICATFSSNSDGWLSAPGGSRNHSSGIMLRNTTDNEDGKAGRVLYIAFRETTSWQQLVAWMSLYGTTVVGEHGEAVLSSLYSLVYDRRDLAGNPMVNNIKRAVINAVESETDRGPIDKIVVTGMSLGGALASCAAYDLSCRYKQKVELFTFATPRIGNRAFVNTLCENLLCATRIEANEGDNVIGYKRCQEGFFHAGLSVRLTEDGRMYFGFNDVRSTLAWRVGRNHRRDYYLSTILRTVSRFNGER